VVEPAASDGLVGTAAELGADCPLVGVGSAEGATTGAFDEHATRATTVAADSRTSTHRRDDCSR
jgi:hypothetical protein